MRLKLNGEDHELANGATIRDLLADLDLTKKRIAVEVNRAIVARESYHEKILQDGDVVEVVHFIGGG